MYQCDYKAAEETNTDHPSAPPSPLPPPSRVRQSVPAFGGIIYTVPLERGGPWWLPVYASPSQP